MSTQDLWVKESPITLVEGEEPIYTITVNGVTSISNLTVKIYKNGTDTTATNIPSGSATATGNVITLPTIKNLVGDSVYVVVVKGTFDTSVVARKIELIVQKPGKEQW